MKRKALIALVLLVVVTLLAGCGGVSQEEFDAAVADKDAAKAQVTTLQGQLTSANTAKTTAETALTAATAAKTKAEADLATAQAALTKANSDLTASKTQVTTLTTQVATLTAKVTALEKEVADLKAAAGGGGGGTTPPPSGGFTGTKYTNTEYGFSFQYPTDWTEKTASLTPGTIKFFGNPATYQVPAIYVVIIDQSAATNLEGAFKAYITGTGTSYTFKSYTNSTSVTIGGVACTKADIVYTGAYGDLDGTMVGFTKNNKWVLIGVIQYPALGANFASATQKNDIVGSITIP
jgi:polyhydroxyalkanoate synthesis regulator phasin